MTDETQRAEAAEDQPPEKSTGRSWAHTAQVVLVTAIVFAFFAYLASIDAL